MGHRFPLSQHSFGRHEDVAIFSAPFSGRYNMHTCIFLQVSLTPPAGSINVNFSFGANWGLENHCPWFCGFPRVSRVFGDRYVYLSVGMPAGLSRSASPATLDLPVRSPR